MVFAPKLAWRGGSASSARAVSIPSQVALANEVFRPGEAEIQQAQRLLDAARAATGNGAGAFLLDGRMIDTPDIRRAEAIVANGRQD